MPDVSDDDLAADDLKAVERWQLPGCVFYPEQILLDGFVNGTLNIHFGLEQIFYVGRLDIRAPLPEFLVDELGSQVEDVSEDALVDGVFIIVVRLDDATHIIIEELQLTAHITVDGCRGQHLTSKEVAQYLHHRIGLVDGLESPLYQ